MKKIFFLLFLVVASTSFAWELKTGTYNLYGTSPSGSAYHGTVVIAPQGDNYSVTWYIGDLQTQVGIGIHRSWEDVLSVAFADLSKGYWGTASYKVSAWGEIEGVWTSSTGYYQGTESLKWINGYYH